MTVWYKSRWSNGLTFGVFFLLRKKPVFEREILGFVDYVWSNPVTYDKISWFTISNIHHLKTFWEEKNIIMLVFFQNNKKQIVLQNYTTTGHSLEQV